MTLRPILRNLTIPLLGLVLTGLAATPAEANEPTAPATVQKTVNVNQASATELARLPRVGEKLAERIIEYRKDHGPFKRAEDLMEVKGIGEKMFQNLKPYVAVAGPTTLTEKVSSAKSKTGSKSKTSKPAAAPSAT